MKLLYSENLELRFLRKSDIEDVRKNITARTVRWFDNIPFPYTLDDARKYIENSIINIKNKSSYDFGIIFEGSLVGTISLNDIDWKKRDARIAYLLSENFWGKRIMSEAVECVLEYGFGEMNLSRIYTGVIMENVASYRILEKFGFRKESINKDKYFIRGKYYDEIVFGLDKCYK